MSRWRIPLALGVLLGLSAYVYLVEIKGGEERQKKKEESEKVLSFKKEQITGVTLAHLSEKIHLEKVNGQWKIQEPLQTLPDAEAVERLLGSLLAMRISHDLGKPTDLAPYNLRNPPASVELKESSPKPPPVLFVGDDSPTGGGAYARLGQDGKILIVSGAEPVRAATLFSLRDKTFFKFDPAKLSGLRLLREKDEISLRKAGGKWGLESPVKIPAEDSTISDLVYALERLTVTEFVEEKPSQESLAKRGLRPSRIRVVLRGDDWKIDPEISIGAAEAGSLYALHPASGALVKVSDSIEAKLKSSLADLRRKELMPYQRWDLAGFRVTGATPQPLELKRKGDREWERISPSSAILPDESVDTLLRSLTDLKAEGFLDRPSPKLAAYGLDPPAARLEFRKQGEESSGASVLLVGKSDGHGKIYLKDLQWPSIVLVQEETWKRAGQEVRKVAEEKPSSQALPQTAPATQAVPAKK